MRPCTQCGQLVEDSANFCHICGERLPDEPKPLPPPPLDDFDDKPPTGRSWFIALAMAGFVLLVAVGTALVLNDPEQGQPSGSTTPTPEPTSAITDPSLPPVVAAVTPAEVLAGRETVQLRIDVGNCTGCEITAIPADGTARQTATVAQDSATFAMPGPSTLGLSFTIGHPEGFGSADGPNALVLAPAGVPAGSQVRVSDVIEANEVALCWAGTAQATASIAIRVDPFSDGTPVGGLRAWADPAVQVLSPVAPPSAEGTVEESALAGCAQQWALLAG